MWRETGPDLHRRLFLGLHRCRSCRRLLGVAHTLLRRSESAETVLSEDLMVLRSGYGRVQCTRLARGGRDLVRKMRRGVKGAQRRVQSMQRTWGGCGRGFGGCAEGAQRVDEDGARGGYAEGAERGLRGLGVRRRCKGERGWGGMGVGGGRVRAVRVRRRVRRVRRLSGGCTACAEGAKVVRRYRSRETVMGKGVRAGCAWDCRLHLRDALREVERHVVHLHGLKVRMSGGRKEACRGAAF